MFCGFDLCWCMIWFWFVYFKLVDCWLVLLVLISCWFVLDLVFCFTWVWVDTLCLFASCLVYLIWRFADLNYCELLFGVFDLICCFIWLWVALFCTYCLDFPTLCFWVWCFEIWLVVFIVVGCKLFTLNFGFGYFMWFCWCVEVSLLVLLCGLIFVSALVVCYNCLILLIGCF